MTTTSVKKKNTKKKTTTTSDESKARSGRVQSVAFYVKATTLSVFFFLFASSGFLSSRNWSASSSSSSSSLARRGGGGVVLGAAAAASRSFFYPGDGESDEEEDGEEEEEEERRRRKLLTSKFARVESGLTNKVKNQQLSDSLKSNAANIGHEDHSYAQKKAGLESRATVAKSLKGARLAANAKRKNEAIREGQNAVGLAMAAAKEKKRGVLSNMEDFKKMKQKEREEKSQRVEAHVGAMRSKLEGRAKEALRQRKIKENVIETLHHKRVVGKWAEAADKAVAEEKEAERKKEELKKEQEEKRKEKAKTTWSKMSTAMDAVQKFKNKEVKKEEGGEEDEEDEDPQVEPGGGCCS